MKPLRVLVVDDSAVVRKLLADALRAEPDFEVVGGAGDPFVARDLILRLEPDVLTLDIEMPRMDGLSFLKRLMAHRPMPVIVISSVTQTGSATAIDALRAGAVDVIPKPGGPYSVGQVAERLKERLRGLRHARPRQQAAAPANATARSAAIAFAPAAVRGGLIVIGASTGGPQALEAILTRLPAVTPPIVVVQHMPAQFTRHFAERLDGVCAMRVVESRGSEPLEAGTVYVAPGNHHLVVERHGIRLMTRLVDSDPVHHQRPAVDVLFNSAARLNVPTVAVLLTGMGTDGADGMVALRAIGAETIAEDELSCVVFGMPRAAIEAGGAMHVATLLRIPSLLVESSARVAVRPAC